jgi:hypothetical protein
LSPIQLLSNNKHVSNYGKTSHAKETCHNGKREEVSFHVVPTKVVEPITKVIAQPVKPARVPSKYPCIICFSSKHHAFNCSRKAKVQNMFQIKPNITPTITKKNPIPNNVPINVVAIVTTCSQTLE